MAQWVSEMIQERNHGLGYGSCQGHWTLLFEASFVLLGVVSIPGSAQALLLAQSLWVTPGSSQNLWGPVIQG